MPYLPSLLHHLLQQLRAYFHFSFQQLLSFQVLHLLRYWSDPHQKYRIHFLISLEMVQDHYSVSCFPFHLSCQLISYADMFDVLHPKLSCLQEFQTCNAKLVLVQQHQVPHQNDRLFFPLYRVETLLVHQLVEVSVTD